MSQTSTSGNLAIETPAPARDLGHALHQVAQALHNLQFGTVTIIVQDGVPIQVERTEKKRLCRPPRQSTA